MVIQKNNIDSQINSNVEGNSSTWTFQAPKTLSIRVGTNMQARQPITRQIAINTLAAMHRRFSLPGPVQPHSRPIAEFRASANKSLDMLRQTIQSAVTREIDQVIKKYLEKFFVPAVNNIRLNLGDESVSEDQLAQNKRKEMDLDSSLKPKKLKQEDNSDSGTSSPIPFSAIRDPEKWNPARLTQDTLFIMGSHAHKVLGLGNARGRLYSRHAGLPRYPADSADKEWIASHNLVNAVGGKTYIMRSLSGDICEVSPQPSTSNNEEDKFKIEDIKIEAHDDFDSANFNASQYMSNSDGAGADFADIKVEDIEDIKVDGIKVEDLEEMKVDGIKVEDLDDSSIKVEDIDNINVERTKVDDIKLETDETFDMNKQTDNDDSNLEGLLDADIEFLSRNLGNIESDADARKTIEKLTGANPDTITLVGDEFDLGSTLNSNFSGNQTTKCITVASTTSGMIHSVPVAHITTPRITGSTVHYYTSSGIQPGQRTVHHLPKATVTIQSLPQSSSQMIRGIPINAKSGTISTVMSQGTAGQTSIIGFGARTSNATIISTPAQYVNVSSKSFPTGNILHNAIISKNIVTNSNTSRFSFNLTTVQPHSAKNSAGSDFDSISTTKDMIDNTCNSSLMLKKVLTLGSAGSAKSFIMHNTQKVLSTGFATGATPPPNVTIVSSGSALGSALGAVPNVVVGSTSQNLSATHATLSALLASNTENLQQNIS
ncbi:unnamed protein product [Leptidea sinapis]|uniref:Uncharacterized protein n=1 Tax=Leptidea sinapis TaxID=189913 RepID=A0A5E4QWZ5_9NEOP|nr:unnamed protein product [Leptidea sinapis]